MVSASSSSIRCCRVCAPRSNRCGGRRLPRRAGCGRRARGRSHGWGAHGRLGHELGFGRLRDRAPVAHVLEHVRLPRGEAGEAGPRLLLGLALAAQLAHELEVLVVGDAPLARRRHCELLEQVVKRLALGDDRTGACLVAPRRRQPADVPGGDDHRDTEPAHERDEIGGVADLFTEREIEDHGSRSLGAGEVGQQGLAGRGRHDPCTEPEADHRIDQCVGDQGVVFDDRDGWESLADCCRKRPHPAVVVDLVPRRRHGTTALLVHDQWPPARRHRHTTRLVPDAPARATVQRFHHAPPVVPSSDPTVTVCRLGGDCHGSRVTTTAGRSDCAMPVRTRRPTGSIVRSATPAGRAGSGCRGRTGRCRIPG